MRRALVIGIDDYPTEPLSGCVNDALSVASVLRTNGDGSPNFDIKTLTSNEKPIDIGTLNNALDSLFDTSTDVETALFYFAGHGLINNIGDGHIVAQDGKNGAWGCSLSDLITRANQAYPKIKSSVIILDSCHSGGIGEIPAIGSTASSIGPGVTILTSCHRTQTAQEFDGHGLFTGILIESLNGSAADICGRITPASVYAHVDQILGPWEQRPIYKANVQSFLTLRQIQPKIPLEILRALPSYFTFPTEVFSLDPSYEPDRGNVPEAIQKIPVNENNARVFKQLQTCNRYGLIVPVDAEHMYFAAINSTGCKLTALGAHYRKLAESGRI